MLKNLIYKVPEDSSDSYYQAIKSFRIDPHQDLSRVKSRIGIDAATSYAHLYFNNKKNLKRLRRELDLHQREYNPLNGQYDVLLVMPPYAAMNRSLIHRNLRQYSGLAMTAGFAHVSHAQLNSHNALEGARRLFKLVEEKRSQGRQLILVSFSYGSAFVRIMLDQMTEEERKSIKGWLNVSGLIFGSPRFHCSDGKSFYRRMNKTLRSFSCEQTYLTPQFQSHGIKTVHVLGLKSRRAMSFSELKMHEFMKAWGPNDGMIPFAPYQKVEGPVLTLLNQGHCVDLRQFSSTYVKILSSMVSTIPLRGVNALKPGLQDSLSFE